MDTYKKLRSKPSWAVWKHFESICKIPRPSGHEQKLRRYLIDFADKNKLPWKMDDVGNLVTAQNS